MSVPVGVSSGKAKHLPNGRLFKQDIFGRPDFLVAG